MHIVVNDTNIFLDLIHANFLDLIFLLEIEIHTTDFIISEILEAEQQAAIQNFIDKGLLFVASFASQEISDIYSLHHTHQGLSPQDCSVWYYSKKQNYTLCTGDGLLRKKAIQDGVNVKGILWFFDELIANNLLDPLDAVHKLQKLLSLGTRLPIPECNRRIIEWRNL